jgi:hypothetical protein
MNGSDTRSEDMPFITKLAGGACSGITVACVLTPVELIKCRMQTANEGAVRYKSTLDCLFKTVQEGGIRSLFHGFVGTLCREIPGNAGAPRSRRPSSERRPLRRPRRPPAPPAALRRCGAAARRRGGAAARRRGPSTRGGLTGLSSFSIA